MIRLDLDATPQAHAIALADMRAALRKLADDAENIADDVKARGLYSLPWRAHAATIRDAIAKLAEIDAFGTVDALTPKGF